MIAVADLIFRSGDKNNKFGCMEVDHVVFQATILLSFASLVLVTCLLQSKISKILIISKIDLMITMQYSRTVKKLAMVIYSLSGIRLIRVVLRYLAHSLVDACIFEI